MIAEVTFSPEYPNYFAYDIYAGYQDRHCLTHIRYQKMGDVWVRHFHFYTSNNDVHTFPEELSDAEAKYVITTGIDPRKLR